MNHDFLESAIEAVDNALALEWFACIGEPLPGSPVRLVHSWGEALTFLSEHNYLRIREQAYERYVAQLTILAPRHLGQIQRVLEEIIPHVTRCADDAMSNTSGLTFAQFGAVREIVMQDMQYFAIESAFISTMPNTGFFRSSMFYYSVGHFPCGWEGPLSQSGRRVVF